MYLRYSKKNSKFSHCPICIITKLNSNHMYSAWRRWHLGGPQCYWWWPGIGRNLGIAHRARNSCELWVELAVQYTVMFCASLEAKHTASPLKIKPLACLCLQYGRPNIGLESIRTINMYTEYQSRTSLFYLLVLLLIRYTLIIRAVATVKFLANAHYQVSTQVL